MDLSAPIFRLKRQAKVMSRETGIALNEALDRLARAEGFAGWSHLSAAMAKSRLAGELLGAFVPGDLVLLAARPGHGKTMLGLELLVETVRDGHPGYFFTLDYHSGHVLARLRELDVDPGEVAEGLEVDTSDLVSAPYILEQVSAAPPGAVVVIDYLQLLDQCRSSPALADQVAALHDAARARGLVIVVISQIDRRFEMKAKAMPDLDDIRLPNPVDLGLFTKTCFLNDGQIRLERHM